MRVDLTVRPLHVRAWRTYGNYRRIYGRLDSLIATVSLLWLNRKARR